MLYEQEMIEINLNVPNTPEERQVRLAGASAKPRVDADDLEGTVEMRRQQLIYWPPMPVDDGKPQIRFYAVGPSSYQIRCPMCKQRADTETVQMSGALGQLSCLLSTLSCCFPIFWLSFAYCCLQSRLKSKRLFCNRCGGHLGFFMRPT